MAIEKTQGAKFDSKLTTAEISRRVKADLMAAQKKGELPKGKYSVKSSVGTLYASITVRMADLEGVTIHETGWREEEHGRITFKGIFGAPGMGYTDAWKAVTEKVRGIVSAYNRCESDIYADYCNTNFHAHVEASHDWSQADLKKAMVES